MEEMNKLTEEQELHVLKKHIDMLSEYFDTVQIFTGRYEPETKTTITCSNGIGDKMSRYGHVKKWLMQEEDEFLDY